MRWRNWILALNRGCVYLIVFLVPLVFSERLFLTYELPKLVAFRVLVLAMLLATVWRIFLVGKVEILQVLSERWLRATCLGILAILLLSNLLALAPELSFWGSYFRLQGSYTFIHYLVFFLLLGLNFHKDIAWERSFVFLGGAFFLVTIYAILQGFGIDFTNFDLQAASLGRSFSSLGQPNYLASYILIVFFPLLGLVLAKKSYGMSALLTVLAALSLGMSGSRAGMIGFAVGALIFTLLWHFFIKKQRAVIALILLSLGVSFFVMDREEADLVRSFDSRVHIWETSIEALQDAPIFGYGLDSFSLIFPRYTDGSLLTTEASNVIPDRAHNNILDILLSVGILGLVLFLAIFWIIWKKTLKSLARKSFKRRAQTIGAFAGLIAICSAHALGFSMTVHYVISVFILGYMAFLLSDGKTAKKKLELNPFFKKFVISLMAIFVMGSIVFYNLFFLIADHKLRNSLEYLQSAEVFTAKDLLDEATLFYPYQSYIFYVLAAVNKEVGAEQAALNAVNSALDFSNGEDGHAYFLLGQITGNVDFYEKASDLMPHSPALLLNWGVFEVQNENCELGIELLSEYVDILPKSWKNPGTEEARLFYKHNPKFDIAIEHLGLCLEKIPDF